ncbi:hypothetical protein AB0G74_27745 [Streptomyces sp. NPDC020875]|uniref:hypothetical protein n=1 Tax=Streptomyces sp. NPDC020875 TaxID=3154898 RepID=UPI0033D1504F
MKNKPDPLDEMPELKAAVASACREAPSEARERQIRAHARELVRALRHADHPLGTDADLTDVFDRASLKTYERLALAGELRDRGAIRPTAEATANTRSGVMALLQRELGLTVVHLRHQEEQPRKEPVDAARRERMRTSLQTAADYIGRSTRWTAEGGLLASGFPRWVRMLAMASVTLDTGSRVGELCVLRLENLSPALEEVRIERRPQNARPGDPPSLEIYPLRRTTRAALIRWLLVRRLLMSEVTGGADALWVSVRGNHSGAADPETGPRNRPPGTPLRPRGAGRAYTAAVAKVNTELGGTLGWSPLPERMEQLRRGVAASKVRLAAPHPDAETAAALMGRLEEAGRQLSALPDTSAAATTGLAARTEARTVLREAWRLGIEHQVQLDVLGGSGLLAYDTPRAGWEPELLRALDRAARLTPR